MSEAPDAAPHICRICGGPPERIVRAREMMYGTRDEFTYFVCAHCGCLQIEAVPDDIGRYYPADYYSFRADARPARGLRAGLDRRRRLYAVERRGSLGRLLCALRPPDERLGVYGALGLTRDDAVLDVGCGGGQLVVDLIDLGFRRALGIDKFVPRDLVVDGRTIVARADVFDLDPARERFDLVTFHGSFEHMDRGGDVLARAAALLTPRGRILVRIPTVSSAAWRRYGAEWVQLDAPRHFYLHSRRSLRLLAGRAGLRLARVWCDSNGFQIWGSELLRRDIPLEARFAYAPGQPEALYTQVEIDGFEREARSLNAQGQGDQICAVLVPES